MVVWFLVDVVVAVTEVEAEFEVVEVDSLRWVESEDMEPHSQVDSDIEDEVEVGVFDSLLLVVYTE